MSGFFVISDDTALAPWMTKDAQWTAPKIRIFEDGSRGVVENEVNAFVAGDDIGVCAISGSSPVTCSYSDEATGLLTYWHVVTVIYQERRP